MNPKYLFLFLGVASGFVITTLYSKFISSKQKSENVKDENQNQEEEEEEEENDNVNLDKINVNSELFGIFVIRKDLKMGKGKICAQCGHASLGIFCKILRQIPGVAQNWFDNKFQKQFFYCNSLEELNEIRNRAIQNNLFTEVIRDAGRTQIAAGSVTVLAVGPVTAEQIPILTKGLTMIKK